MTDTTTTIPALAAIDTTKASVYNEIKQQSSINDIFAKETANSIVFFGKSLALWEDELALFIDTGELSPTEIRALWVELNHKTQIAAHYHELAAAANAVTISAAENRKASLVSAIVSHYVSINQQPPPNTVIDRMAESYLQELHQTEKLNRLCKEYWKRKLQTLERIEQHLKGISMSLTVQAKYESGE